jgi:hypothetical protein
LRCFTFAKVLILVLPLQLIEAKHTLLLAVILLLNEISSFDSLRSFLDRPDLAWQWEQF